MSKTSEYVIALSEGLNEEEVTYLLYKQQLEEWEQRVKQNPEP